MKTSESIKAIAAALVKAQPGIKSATKDATNPHFKSRYADLASVMEACKSALNEQGIAFLQPVSTCEQGVVVETLLLHSSGEWISESLAVPVSKNDAQGVGSAISYGKRYGLQSFVGIPSEDDDGNAATAAPPPKVIGSSARAETVDAMSRMSPEEQKFLHGVAVEVLDKANELTPEQLHAFVTLKHLDGDELTALWSLLPSKVRSKIRDGKQPAMAEQA